MASCGGVAYNSSMKPVILLLLLLVVACGREAAVTPSNQPAGQMVFIEVDGADQHISSYDVDSGTVARLFTADPNGFVSNIAVSPDTSQLLLAYAAPPPEGEIQFGYTSLFLTRFANPDTLTPVQTSSRPGESYFNPTWSPDGTTIAYTHILPDPADPTQFEIRLESLTLESGEARLLAEEAIWPRFSPDGNHLVFVTVDPDTLGNALWLANSDGSSAEQLLYPNQFRVVDVPMFSPDGAFVYFTASENEQGRRFWWDLLLGVKTAAAHNIPSDWYRVPSEGGAVERLTTLQEVGIYGAFAPGGKMIGFSTFNGLYTMRPDGSAVERILSLNATTSFDWVGEPDAD